MVINVKNIVLGVGIFVVYLLMLGYGIEAFYPGPKYEAYCAPGSFESRYPSKLAPGIVPNCSFSAALQAQENACYQAGGGPVYNYSEAGCPISAECNYCNKYFNEAKVAHDKVVFVIAVIVGILTLFIGYGILSVEPVGSALMASGVGAIFYGSVRNWENLSNVWRFLLLVVALVLLIWIALRINRQKKKAWQFWK